MFYSNYSDNSNLANQSQQLSELNTELGNKAPTSHANSSTTYGVGTTTAYGHCMTINNLTTESHANGKALSAFQGYKLNQSISNIVETLNSLGSSAYKDYTATVTEDSEELFTSGGAYDYLNSLLYVGSVTFSETTVTYCSGTSISKSCKKSGYTPIGIVSVNTGDVAVFPVTYTVSDNKAYITLSSADDSQRTCTPYVNVLYIKTI